MKNQDRLRHLHYRAKQLLDQLDGMAGECCDLMGIDPDSQSDDAERCRDIVWHGVAPEFVEAQLKNKKVKQ